MWESEVRIFPRRSARSLPWSRCFTEWCWSRQMTWRRRSENTSAAVPSIILSRWWTTRRQSSDARPPILRMPAACRIRTIILPRTTLRWLHRQHWKSMNSARSSIRRLIRYRRRTGRRRSGPWQATIPCWSVRTISIRASSAERTAIRIWRRARWRPLRRETEWRWLPCRFMRRTVPMQRKTTWRSWITASAISRKWQSERRNTMFPEARSSFRRMRPLTTAA